MLVVVVVLVTVLVDVAVDPVLELVELLELLFPVFGNATLSVFERHSTIPGISALLLLFAFPDWP